MKFELLIFPPGKGRLRVTSAYVCATPASAPSEYDEKDPRKGHILLTNESTSEAECHQHIDELINQLKRIKNEASRKFSKSKSKPH